jgi:hypothetical protein
MMRMVVWSLALLHLPAMDSQMAVPCLSCADDADDSASNTGNLDLGQGLAAESGHKQMPLLRVMRMDMEMHIADLRTMEKNVCRCSGGKDDLPNVQ